ncbi:MAG: UbiA family prenyltransferase [Chlorobium sp.]|nr:UbiA family prenyltransferase [Chlorobium sp.]
MTNSQGQNVFVTAVKHKIKLYLPLIKSLQTGLLLVTGITGYLSTRCPLMPISAFIGLVGSLFLAISGSTILNMVYDRDIDAKMHRTAKRPLPSGAVDAREALLIGLLCSSLGVLWGFLLDPLYGLVVLAGLFFDVVIYTMWLKRRTPWAIVWGGISGGMPILAGRVLGTGSIDAVGILFAVTVLLWIPTHILTFNIRYAEDYRRAKIPTFVDYGVRQTRIVIAISSIAAAIGMASCLIILGFSWGYLRVLALLTIGIIGMAVTSMANPSAKTDMRLFKTASLYMLGAMITVSIGSLL